MKVVLGKQLFTSEIFKVYGTFFIHAHILYKDY